MDGRHRTDVAEHRFHLVHECNQTTKFALIRTLMDVIRIILRENPDVIISTGAAPGLIALWVGKLVGARTVWVDSIANANELSLSGKIAGRFATLWLTQWSSLSTEHGPCYKGSVL